jgi:cell wall-associated protease
LTDVAFDPRKEIIGDDPANFADTKYGNSDVTGPDAGHGTHVAGTVGGRANLIAGAAGVAADVSLVSMRIVPNGDEYDKDIALAVRRAVDMGAEIIVMS